MRGYLQSCLFVLHLARVCESALSFNAYDLGLSGIYPRQQYQTVGFEAPSVKFTQWDSRCDHGNLLLAPSGPGVPRQARGPVMLDSRGELIWMGNDRWKDAASLDVQRYKGEDYLTFWTRDEAKTRENDYHRDRFYVMLNSSYEVAYVIRPRGKGLKGDSHEFRITPQGTALITIYHKRQTDCTLLGLGKTCWIQDGMFQEIDIETGNLIFEWRSTDHIEMSDAFSSPCHKDGYGKSQQDSFDWFHINSVYKLPAGDYIVSARYMHAVMCISGTTGELLWQLGGKKNSFKDLDSAITFEWQHHAVWLGNNTLTVFDNHANNVFYTHGKHSRAMIIQLDLEKMTASLLQDYIHPDEIVNVSQGSAQRLPKTENIFVGFGNSPNFVEFDADGTVLCSARYAPQIVFGILDFGIVKSYRIFKKHWKGSPTALPNMKIVKGQVYVSWNGATEVQSWQLQTSETESNSFTPLQQLESDSFETAFTLAEDQGFVRVAAMDEAGSILTYSPVHKIPRPMPNLAWLLIPIGFCLIASMLLLRHMIVVRYSSLWRRRVRELCKRRSFQKEVDTAQQEERTERTPLIPV